MKIAIIDKFPVLRSGLRLFLEGIYDQATIVELETIQSLPDADEMHQFELIILGINGESGTNYFREINEIRSFHPTVKFVVYDEHPAIFMVRGYLSAGVNGYLSKHSDLYELKSCVHEALLGKRYVGQEIVSMLLNSASIAMQNMAILRTKSKLTAREYEIARYLSQGMRTGWIARQLNRKASTVSTIKLSIFKKLEIDNIIALREEIRPYDLRFAAEY